MPTLVEVCQDVILAIESLPDDALGTGHADETSWPIKAELLTNLRAAILAHVEARCVWTLEASDAVPRGYAQFWLTACGHEASQHDDRGDWCTYCGKPIERKEAAHV